jgi:3'-5' exoribonuclease
VPQLAEGRLLLLQHLIASHQGRYEWQSPREPRTLEALVLHYADDLDAKINQAGALLDAVNSGWTAYDRSFARDFLKHRLPEAEPAWRAMMAPDEPPTPQASAAAPPAMAAAMPAAAPQPNTAEPDAPVSREPDAPAPRAAPPAQPAAAEEAAPGAALRTLDLFADGDKA